MSDLQLELEPPLARLVLRRPERRNAVTAAMWRDLARLCAEVEARADVEAVVVQGAGGHFCAGADIAEFDEVFADRDSARQYLQSVERGLESLCEIDRPTIAKMEGSAVGGGLAIALACDLRFAAEDAHVAVPPAKLGLVYGPVETRLLVETVGPACARDLLFSARSLGAEEAQALGLIHRRFPVSALEGAVAAQARSWARLSRTSIRGAKKAIRAALASEYDILRTVVEDAAMGEDFREGRAAFRDKRSPMFSRT
jgi:enoyl-CoA hydratase/carnithine racemase